MYRNTDQSYGSVAKFLHWLIFFLIICMLLVGFFMDGVSDKKLQGYVYNLHEVTGICVLGLMIFRAIWVLNNPKPRLPFGTPAWQKMAERAVHFLIYAALICMPIAGWVNSVSAGYVPYFFSFSFALPIPVDEKIKHISGAVHYYLAWTIIALISIHVLAALYHAVIKKDDVLSRMM